MDKDRVERIFSMFMYLTYNRNKNVEDLAKMLGVNKSTIYRYIDLYKSLGVERNNEFVQDEVLEAVQKIVSKVNKNFQAYSQISKVTLLKEPLEMTTSQKVKRNFVAKTY